jgi:ribosomal protein S6--L-glutamate ligase
MERRAAPGEFRANLHRGGTAHGIKLSPEERRTAVKAAKTLGLNVSGVDMLRAADGPVVIEVNSSPGLEGIESASGQDVAADIIAFLEKHSAPGKTRDRVKG